MGRGEGRKRSWMRCAEVADACAQAANAAATVQSIVSTRGCAAHPGFVGSFQAMPAVARVRQNRTGRLRKGGGGGSQIPGRCIVCGEDMRTSETLLCRDPCDSTCHLACLPSHPPPGRPAAGGLGRSVLSECEARARTQRQCSARGRHEARRQPQHTGALEPKVGAGANGVLHWGLPPAQAARGRGPGSGQGCSRLAPRRGRRRARSG